MVAFFLRQHTASFFWSLMLCCLLITHPAYADDVGATQLALDYPIGSMTSTKIADQALQRAADVNAAIDARFTQEQQACYSRFFASACVADAKERKRVASNQVKRVKNEAEEFKRRERVVEHDKAEQQRITSEKTAADNAPPLRNRMAEHDAKLKQIEAQQIADGPKRESNVAAYEKKVHDAELRMKEALEKKAVAKP